MLFAQGNNLLVIMIDRVVAGKLLRRINLRVVGVYFKPRRAGGKTGAGAVGG